MIVVDALTIRISDVFRLRSLPADLFNRYVVKKNFVQVQSPIQ